MPILEDLQKLTKPLFELPDLEDEDVDGTTSRINSHGAVSNDDTSQKRKRNIIDLSIADDSKYGGTKVSRNDVFDEFSDIAGLGDRSQEFDSAGDDVDSEDMKSSMTTKDNVGKEWEEDDESESETKSDDDQENHADVDNITRSGDLSDDIDDRSESDTESEANENGENMNSSPAVTMKDLIKTVDQNKHRRKAESVCTQLQTWEQLLHVKIKLQAALRHFNQLPRGQLAKELSNEADEETVRNMRIAHSNAVKLVSMFLEAENLLLSTSTLAKSVVVAQGEDSEDEEIESSEDENCEPEHDENGEEEKEDEEKDGKREVEDQSRSRATSMSVKSLSRRLCENEERFAKFRNSTLLKWDERTRLLAAHRPKHASTDFSAFEKNDIVSQIEQICADKSRLVKRSHVKKSDIDRIGGNAEAEEDEEIFDDNDFYQSLLRELIERKTCNTQDPVAMTRHYIELQNLNCKRVKKRDIDHRASKDRKIKYIPIPKLVNFHPAMPEMVEWTHESRNELFKSLFS